jgi:hypothetical protein
MISIFAQKELRYMVNLEFTYPALEPRALEDNSNDSYDSS